MHHTALRSAACHDMGPSVAASVLKWRLQVLPTTTANVRARSWSSCAGQRRKSLTTAATQQHISTEQQQHVEQIDSQEPQAVKHELDQPAVHYSNGNQGSSSGPIPQGLPLPMVWDSIKALQQMVTGPQAPSSQSSTDVTADSSHGSSSSPSGHQQALARNLASSLKQLAPRHDGISGDAAPGLDDNVLRLVQTLQQLRSVVSAEGWDGFVDDVQLAAYDALQLTAVETAVTASVADADEALIIGSIDQNGYSSVAGRPGLATPKSAAATAGTHDEVSASSSSMSVTGRHMITQLPAVSSAAATNMHQHHHHQQEASDEGPRAEGGRNAAVAATATTAVEDEQLTHQVVNKLQMLQGQLQQYTQQQQQYTKQQQYAQQHQQQPLVATTEPTKNSSGLVAAAAPSTTVLQDSDVAVATGASSSNVSSSNASSDAAKPSSSNASSSNGSSSPPSFPKYDYLVFGGGGARCFGYAGALHALMQLGLVGQLKGVSGSSGGAVYALLAALKFSVSEVQAAMGTLPESETLSWLRLNSRLGLSDGEATFRQIEAAIATKLGVPHPTLSDVSAAAGCPITLAATSLARRAPVYLSSTTHPDMLVRDALRASCAIPFFFTPLRVPASPSSTSGACDLLVDGCITDCTPLAGLSVGGGGGWDPKRTLVLAVHDAAGLESPDFQGLLTGLISTVMQAGIHHTLASGIDLLNLWPAVAAVNPLQFRMQADQARDVIARSQALAEEFAVNKMKNWEAAAADLSGADHRDSIQQQQQQRQEKIGFDTIMSYDGGSVAEEDWDVSDLAGFKGWEGQGISDDEDAEYPSTTVSLHQQQQQQQEDSEEQQTQDQDGDEGSSEGLQWPSGWGIGLGGVLGSLTGGSGGGSRGSNAGSIADTADSKPDSGGMWDLPNRWLGRLAVEKLLQAALNNRGQGSNTVVNNTQANKHTVMSAEFDSPSEVLSSHFSESDWQAIQDVLEQQEDILQQQERAMNVPLRQQRAERCEAVTPQEVKLVDNDGLEQLCLVSTSIEDADGVASVNRASSSKVGVAEGK